MLLLGTCNPQGEQSTYNGLYLKQEEMQQMYEENALQNLPVKQEHTGENVGRVVSSFIDNNNKLQCVLEIDESNFAGSLAAGFVRDNIAKELSLGYVVDVQNSDNELKAINKKVLEISLVRKGAREHCQIHAYESENRDLVWKQDPWFTFNLQ